MIHPNAKIDRTPRAFVDTAGWLALLNTRDGLHTRAVAVRAELQQRRVRLITTEFVLMEVADALAVLPLRTTVVEFYRGMRQSNTPSAVEIVPLSEQLLAEAWMLFQQRPDKAWGLTDCSSFVVMQGQGIAEAFTSDHHFEQAGFVKLL